MNYSNIMKEIKTTRDFKSTTVKREILEKIVNEGKASLTDIELEIVLFEDGKKAKENLQGKAGYFGKFIESPHYIAVIGNKDQKAKEKAAYAIEAMRFTAHAENLGTCWITVPDTAEIKNDLSIDSSKNLLAFMAVGIRYSGIFKKDIQEKAFRQGATEIAYLDTWGYNPSWEELEQRGLADIFYFTRFAPSWGNRQPWKFLVANEKVILGVKKDYKEDLELDTGIVKFYFEKSCIDHGINAVISNESSMEDIEAMIGEDYEVRGVYTL